jgi:hypothetical protein
MRRTFFLLLLLVVSALTACAQIEMQFWSYVYAEQSTGAIWTEGYTYVYNLDPYLGEYGTNIYADVQSYLSPTGGYGASSTNNCGLGCAYDWFENQVPYLGVTLTLYSNHEGQGYDVNLGNFYMWQSSQSSYNIPSSSTLTFTGIDARNPDNVQWGIAVNGGGFPWQINFNMGGFFQITQGLVAQTDQNQYSGGSTLAYLTGLNYGIAFNGQSCNVVEDQNHSYPKSNSGIVNVGGDGFAPQAVFVSQFGAFLASHVTYYDNSGPCLSLVNPGSLTTLLQRVLDTIDTTQNIRSADSEINIFVPQAFYPPLFGAQNLPPSTDDGMGPAQSDWFQTRGIDWNGNWVPGSIAPCTGLCAVRLSQVCPTNLTMGISVGGQPVAMPCWAVALR